MGKRDTLFISDATARVLDVVARAGVITPSQLAYRLRYRGLGEPAVVKQKSVKNRAAYVAGAVLSRLARRGFLVKTRAARDDYLRVVEYRLTELGVYSLFNWDQEKHRFWL